MSSGESGAPQLADSQFLEAFYTGVIPNQAFRHRDHLRLAWIEVRRLGLAGAEAAVTSGIRRFAAQNGHAPRYNDTLTRFWLRAIDMAVASHPELAFENLLAAEPHLLDKALPFRHWSRERLTDHNAKAHWVEPDLFPLPPPSRCQDRET